MKSVYINLYGFDGKVINYTFKKYFSKWRSMYEDIAPLGYIALIEHKQDYELVEDEKQRFMKAVSYCATAMQKFFDSYCVGRFEIVSLNDLIERHVEDITFCNNIEDFENYSFLKTLFNETLQHYSLEDKKIIFDYMFNGLSKTDIYKKYKINTKYLKELVFNVRKSYFDLLVENGYFAKHKTYFNLLSDFAKFEKQKDILICSLLKEKHIPIEDISNITGVPVEKVPKILMHTKNNMSFFLYQIQKLRKCYFPEYTLQELCV